MSSFSHFTRHSLHPLSVLVVLVPLIVFLQRNPWQYNLENQSTFLPSRTTREIYSSVSRKTTTKQEKVHFDAKWVMTIPLLQRNLDNGSKLQQENPRTAVIHIGPHKTGTTAIQNAMKLYINEMNEDGYEMPSHHLEVLTNGEKTMDTYPEHMAHLVACFERPFSFRRFPCQNDLLQAMRSIGSLKHLNKRKTKAMQASTADNAFDISKEQSDTEDSGKVNLVVSAERFDSDGVDYNKLFDQFLLPMYDNIVIVAYYRRFYDWIESLFNQNNRFFHPMYRASIVEYLSDSKEVLSRYNNNYIAGAVNRYVDYFSTSSNLNKKITKFNSQKYNKNVRILVYNSHVIPEGSKSFDATEVFFCHTLATAKTVSRHYNLGRSEREIYESNGIVHTESLGLQPTKSCLEYRKAKSMINRGTKSQQSDRKGPSTTASSTTLDVMRNKGQALVYSELLSEAINMGYYQMEDEFRASSNLYGKSVFDVIGNLRNNSFWSKTMTKSYQEVVEKVRIHHEIYYNKTQFDFVYNSAKNETYLECLNEPLAEYLLELSIQAELQFFPFSDTYLYERKSTTTQTDNQKQQLIQRLRQDFDIAKRTRLCRVNVRKLLLDDETNHPNGDGWISFFQSLTRTS